MVHTLVKGKGVRQLFDNRKTVGFLRWGRPKYRGFTTMPLGRKRKKERTKKGKKHEHPQTTRRNITLTSRAECP